MKFLTSLTVAATVVGSAFAKDVAPVYIIRQQAAAEPSTASVPEISQTIAQNILLHRIQADNQINFLDALSEGTDIESALEFTRTFGTPPSEDASAKDPFQAVFIVQGLTSNDVKTLEAVIPDIDHQQSFTVSDPAKYDEILRFFDNELSRAAPTELPESDSYGTYGDRPRAGPGLLLFHYDTKMPSYPAEVIAESLQAFMESTQRGELEVILALFPELDRKSYTVASTTEPIPNVDELRRRAAESESVMSEDSTFGADANIPKDESAPVAHPWAAPKGPIPACFQSFNSCTAQTANCSGHGLCVDKFTANSAVAGEAEKRDDTPVCFVCHCYSTLTEGKDQSKGRSTTAWGGNICQKKDVSVPFWLLTGFTVTIIGAVSFAVGLLFNVGEEKLPGVIGAGVSRTK